VRPPPYIHEFDLGGWFPAALALRQFQEPTKRLVPYPRAAEESDLNTFVGSIPGRKTNVNIKFLRS
jgi:hypothetical protein